MCKLYESSVCNTKKSIKVQKQRSSSHNNKNNNNADVFSVDFTGSPPLNRGRTYMMIICVRVAVYVSVIVLIVKLSSLVAAFVTKTPF